MERKGIIYSYWQKCWGKKLCKSYAFAKVGKEMPMDEFDNIFTAIVAACNQFEEQAWLIPRTTFTGK